jgi:putative PIG3 family NAD(P)H quinone oxidoreductase
MTIEAKAVRIEGAGGPEVLTIGTLELDDPGPDDVLVQVHAAGLNRADILQRRGFYPAPPGVVPDVPGLEVSGIVRAVGSRVTDVVAGDRVMAIVPGGGMATHIVIPANELLPVPSSVDLTRAAAFPEAFCTAFDALVLQAGLQLGEVLVVHAVGSGVGTAALQLARALGAIVVGTSRTRDKLDRCADLGLLHPVLVENGRFADQTKAATGPAHVVFDPVGAAYLRENLDTLGIGGRLVVYGLMGGVQTEIPLGTVLQKRLRILGTVLRSRPAAERAALAAAARRHLLPLFGTTLVPIVDTILPMERIADAHRQMEANTTFGKVIMTWDA